MVVGTGLDIVEVARIEKAADGLFLSKNFTTAEIAFIGDRKGSAEVIAGNFAVKEAVLKCLGSGIFDMPLRDIEVLREQSGAPYVNLYGAAAQRAAGMGIIKIHVSISHTGGFAAAQAVAEGV